MKKVICTLSALALLIAGVACKQVSKCPEGAVDLGIVMTREDGTTYSLYWAESNLCESGLCGNPKANGDYYSWGEIKPKDCYDSKTYKWYKRSYGDLEDRLVKYNTNSYYGVVDNKIVLDLEDDVANVTLGGKWRIPTDAEWEALMNQCTWTLTGGGWSVTAPNGNSIYLPKAGYRADTDIYDTSLFGYYRSSSLDTDNPMFAQIVFLQYGNVYRCGMFRTTGFSVRPVTE